MGWPRPLPPPIGCNLSTNPKRKPKWRRCVAASIAVGPSAILTGSRTRPSDCGWNARFGPVEDRRNNGSSGGSVQALKKVDMLAQSNVASSTPFRLETQHVHQLVVPCVRDSGIQLHSDSLRWRNHPLCHRPGEETVVLLGLRLVGSTPTWSNRENVPNPPHRSQSRGHSLRGSARPLRVLWSDPTGRDWVRG